MSTENLDIKTLESWLWEAACKIRGEIDAPKYKDYILPIIFIKRLSDVFEDEILKFKNEFGDEDTVEEILSEDHGLVRFYIPKNARWDEIKVKTSGVGEFLTEAVRSIARENPKLQGVIDFKDFNETAAGQRIISDESLKDLISVLGRYRLGLKDVNPNILGSAYEYLLRKFAEGSGQSAGEFYTPKEVAILMANILNPQPGEEIYDPCCGSAGLLVKCQLKFQETFKDDTQIEPLKFYGQEILHSTFAMAKMDIFIQDMEASIQLGDTMKRPAFKNDDGSLKSFDIVTANPMWNQDFSQSTYVNDPYERFKFGYPPNNTADWGWIQHMYKSLKNKGRMAIVLDTGAVSRGSGNRGRNKERDIRKEFIKQDLVEAVILLPDNLFYNTTAPGIILIINQNKTNKNKILLINASHLFEKGRPKNYFSNEHIIKISEVYNGWKEEEGLSKSVQKDEVIKNDYNISPSRYIIQNGEEDILPLKDAIVLLKEAEEERIEADQKLKDILNQLGLHYE